MTVALPQGLNFLISDVAKPLIGTQKWAAEYEKMYPMDDDLRQECEEYMDEFDEIEKSKLRKEKEMAETPDEVTIIYY